VPHCVGILAHDAPAWFAFAGGNRLSLDAPVSTRASSTFTVSGLLTSRALGALPGKKLTLHNRRLGRAGWHTVSASSTRQDGSYMFRVTQPSTRLYRVVWDGVCKSAAVLVRTP